MIQTNEMIGHHHATGKNTLTGILVFGSLWGLLDVITTVFISPALHMKQLALCSLTVVIFGFSILTFALLMYRKPAMLPGIGALAALYKLLDLAILKLPVINGSVIYQPVVNPALGIMITSLMFTLIIGLVLNTRLENFFLRTLAGMLTGVLGTITFAYTAFYITHTPPLIVQTPWQFVYPIHGIGAGILGAIFLNVGYWLVMRYREKTISIETKYPAFYYAGSFAFVLICLTLSVAMLEFGV